MAYRGQKFLVCPDCKKKGVTWVPGRHGDDGHACRYCDFHFYDQGSYPADVTNRARLEALNPGYNE